MSYKEAFRTAWFEQIDNALPPALSPAAFWKMWDEMGGAPREDLVDIFLDTMPTAVLAELTHDQIAIFCAALLRALLKTHVERALAHS